MERMTDSITVGRGPKSTCTHYDYVGGCFACRQEKDDLKAMRKAVGQPRFTEAEILKWKIAGIVALLVIISHLTMK